MSTKPKLFVIPLPIDIEGTHFVSEDYKNRVFSLTYFVVESARTARRFFRKAGYTGSLDDMTFYELDKHSKRHFKVDEILKQSKGRDIGLMSEAGYPGIADPGASVVKALSKLNFQVVPMIGPSSIMLALAASGMNGQRFRFHGYLPIDKHDKFQKIEELEMLAERNRETQIFMEAPYRNNKMVEDTIRICDYRTHFCAAVDLTAPTEQIISQTIAEWKKTSYDFHKRPAIFLIGQA